MSRSGLGTLAIILAMLGLAVVTGHPAWGMVTGFAILLVGAGVAVGALPPRSGSQLHIESTAPSQRISGSLVTLSSAAIVAIYAAGYQRTSSAAARFEAQMERRKAAAPLLPKSAAASQPAFPSAVAPTAPRPAGNAPRAVRKPAPKPTEQARTNPGAPAPAPAPPAKSGYKDGTYLGWGRSPHGDIQASVVIENGHIASTAIAQCLTRYSCLWIAPRTPGAGYPDLPSQVVERQSANVDYVSGATESSNAFADAIIEALAKASE